MMAIFEFIHLIEISRLVEISDAQKFSGLWKPMYKPFTFHLSFDCSTLRKKTLQFLLRPMENVCLIRSLTCASLYVSTGKQTWNQWKSTYSWFRESINGETEHEKFWRISFFNTKSWKIYSLNLFLGKTWSFHFASFFFEKSVAYEAQKKNEKFKEKQKIDKITKGHAI